MSLLAKIKWLFYHIIPILITTYILGIPGLIAIILVDGLMFFLAFAFSGYRLAGKIISVGGVATITAWTAYLMCYLLIGFGAPVAVISAITYLLICYLLF